MMMMMTMMLLLIMKNDCYLDNDDDEEEEEVEEEDLIWYIFTIYCIGLSGGLNAPNWTLTHLKGIVNAPHFICIAVHFL